MLPEWYNFSCSRRRRTAMKFDRHWKFTLVISIVVFMCYQRCILSRNFLSSFHCFNVGTKWSWRIESWTVCSTYRLVRTTRAAWIRVSGCLPWRHLLLCELYPPDTPKNSMKCLMHKVVTKSFVARYFDSPLIYRERSSSLSTCTVFDLLRRIAGNESTVVVRCHVFIGSDMGSDNLCERDCVTEMPWSQN